MRFKLSTLMRSDRKARKVPGASAWVETQVSRQRSTSDASSRPGRRTYPPIPVETRLRAGASQTLNEHWRVCSLGWKFPLKTNSRSPALPKVNVVRTTSKTKVDARRIMLTRSLSAVSGAPISRQVVESRCSGGARFRYSDLKEAAPPREPMGFVCGRAGLDDLQSCCCGCAQQLQREIVCFEAAGRGCRDLQQL